MLSASEIVNYDEQSKLCVHIDWLSYCKRSKCDPYICMYISSTNSHRNSLHLFDSKSQSPFVCRILWVVRYGWCMFGMVERTIMCVIRESILYFVYMIGLDTNIEAEYRAWSVTSEFAVNRQQTQTYEHTLWNISRREVIHHPTFNA